METPLEQAFRLLGRSQSIADYVKIPSTISDNDINQKTISHDNFKNYDHSLEINRLTKLREKYNYVEPEKTVIDMEDIIIENTQEIESSEVPNLSGIFDDNFNI
jgi:hypothetical protein